MLNLQSVVALVTLVTFDHSTAQDYAKLVPRRAHNEETHKQSDFVRISKWHKTSKLHRKGQQGKVQQCDPSTGPDSIRSNPDFASAGCVVFDSFASGGFFTKAFATCEVRS